MCVSHELLRVYDARRVKQRKRDSVERLDLLDAASWKVLLEKVLTQKKEEKRTVSTGPRLSRKKRRKRPGG